jgi:carboxylesterase type B
MMLSLLQLAACLLPLTLAAPVDEKRQVPTVGPSVTLSYATVVGSSNGVVDSFRGIPYAKPPVQKLRLMPPQGITGNLGTIVLPPQERACPQFYQQVDKSSLTTSAAGLLADSTAAQMATNAGEDCLTVNVQRPSSAKEGDNLPVLFWIYGGGFEFGSTQTTDATNLITTSIADGKNIIFVAVNYRLGGFGFLPGKKVKAAGVANLGLLDQRAGLKWVADNIAKFGGDPNKVTIWGESAGSISVFDQMALYNGDNTYNGKALFRAAIMDSGSIVPADPVDCAKSEVVFNTVVKNAGCDFATDTLDCLRNLDYTTYLNAGMLPFPSSSPLTSSLIRKPANSVPGIFGYTSVAIAYPPRPDGKVLTASPDVLVKNKKYARVPFIIGDQEDEGTLFSLNQNNISTTDQLIDYMQTYFFNHATRDQVTQLVNLYPDDPSYGSPFRTGPANNIYPQYKRIAALLGDLTFTITRRVFLTYALAANPDVPSWSYLASYFYGTPVLGTFHASDLLTAYGTVPGFASTSIMSYYLSFINNLNPNSGALPTLPQWPRWKDGKFLMHFDVATNSLIGDDFRDNTAQFIAAQPAPVLYI